MGRIQSDRHNQIRLFLSREFSRCERYVGCAVPSRMNDGEIALACSSRPRAKSRGVAAPDRSSTWLDVRGGVTACMKLVVAHRHLMWAVCVEGRH